MFGEAEEVHENLNQDVLCTSRFFNLTSPTKKSETLLREAISAILVVWVVSDMLPTCSEQAILADMTDIEYVINTKNENRDIRDRICKFR